MTMTNHPTNYLIVPGYLGSGAGHWQTIWQGLDNFHKVEQQNWETPDCQQWVETIDKKVAEFESKNVVIVAHSLGCPTIVHWLEKYNRQIKGALFVCPCDIEVDGCPIPATGFTPIPLTKINCKTIVIASTNDMWVSIERAKFFAERWGSEFINLGAAGHVNAESGYGQWREGLEILQRLG